MNLSPIDPTELRALLRSRVVQFAFKKLDGTLRTALGTTNLSSIPAIKHPQGVRESSPSVITFFDMEKQEWRSISVRSEIFMA